VTLGKAWATYDWATRPLDPAALAYAVDDVVHLPTIAETLKAAVAAADIADEVNEANAVVSASVWNGGFDREGMWRLRDIEGASDESLKIVARLYAWRDAAAAAENLPPGRMVNNEVLLLIARHRPTSLADLKKARLKGFVTANHGAALLEAIALAKDDAAPKKPALPPLSSTVQAREQKLKAWRREEADKRTKLEERTVPLQLVLPARALDHLKVHGADDLAAVPQLGAKRSARYGEVLRALCGER
jgi:ribonuclease D